MTVHDYTGITEPHIEAADDYTLERGKPMPSLNHSIIQLNLGAELKNRYKDRFRIVSELSLDLSEWPSVPDLSIYPHLPLDLRNDVTAMTQPPLCTIEIISPSQTLNALTDKADAYFAHGVKSCWLVLLPLANIHVFSAPGEYEVYRAHQILQDSVLDISLPLQEVFEI